MKLAGSKRVKIQCKECPELSEPFRVTLTKDVETEGDCIFLWKDTDFPNGWDIPEDEGLFDDIVYGYCPLHNPLRNKKNDQEIINPDNFQKPPPKTGVETPSDYLGHGKPRQPPTYPSKNATRG